MVYNKAVEVLGYRMTTLKETTHCLTCLLLQHSKISNTFHMYLVLFTQLQLYNVQYTKTGYNNHIHVVHVFVQYMRKQRRWLW